MTTREVTESPVHQGEDERIAYTFDWADIGTPTLPVVAIKDSSLNDVSTTCLSGAASIVADTVVTPLVIALTPGVRYRLECKVTIAGQVFEAYGEIIGEE